MQALSSKQLWLAAKSAVWLAALSPAVRLVFMGVRDELGANPIEAVIHQTGWWGLLLLTTTLAITPVRSLHLTAYVVLDQWFAFEFILEDIAERPFITVGFAAWLILLTLAATSTRGWIRRLRRNWLRLHRLVYLASCLGALHFFWNVKADTVEPLVFSLIIVLLLAAAGAPAISIRPRLAAKRGRHRPWSPLTGSRLVGQRRGSDHTEAGLCLQLAAR
jgi:sulfoxide reductase heme-binding subunit YedZ